MREEADQVCGNHMVKVLNGKLDSLAYGKSVCNVPNGKSHNAFGPSGDLTPAIT